MNTDTVAKLARLGYWTLYGSDGYLHIVRRNQRGTVTRGTHALCGHTARRRDYKHEKPACEDCMRACMAEVKARKYTA